MSKFIIKLIQHTPLIHFQWAQEGAGLRATEVKPKLDKFINRKERKEKNQALNYKMRIKLEDYFTVPESVGKEKLEEYEVPYKHLGWCKKYLLENKPEPDQAFQEYLEKEQIKGTWENLSQEYLIVSHLNRGMSEELEKHSISYLGKTSFFAQESDTSGRAGEDKVLERNGANWCFCEEKWKKLGKKGLLYPGKIIVEIICWDNDILDLIKKYISEFFLCENFGTRQTKGFGSFEVIERMEDGEFIPCAFSDNERIEHLKKNFKFVYERKWNVNEPVSLSVLFKTIVEDYQLMKSGVNYSSIYKESQLFKYGLDNSFYRSLNLSEPIRWEKRFIKKGIKKDITQLGNNINLLYKKDPIFWNKNTENSWEDVPEMYEYRFLRALLGLSEQYMFQIKHKGEAIDCRTGEVRSDQDKIIVKVINDQVERYNSPLLFKVIDNTFYILGNDVFSKLLGESFRFEFYLKSNDNNRIPLKLGEKGKEMDHLLVPEKFSLPDFMKFVMNGEEFKDKYQYKENE